MQYLLAFVLFASLMGCLVILILCGLRFYDQYGPSLALLLPSMVALATAGCAAAIVLDHLEGQP